MDSATASIDSKNVCAECGRVIEILNGDIQFSINVHIQSHKSSEKISEEIHNQIKDYFQESESIPICNKSVDATLNHEELPSLQHPSQNHTLGYECINFVDQSCASRGTSENPNRNKRKKRFNKVELNNKQSQNHSSGNECINSEDQSCASNGTSGNPNRNKRKRFEEVELNTKQNDKVLLDTIFNCMPPALKAHRGFVSDRPLGKAFCNICNVNISPLVLFEHFKTKLHEDNIIVCLKSKLSPALSQIMDFVSFCESNLCCNLCRCKIDICANNDYNTIVNIMAHNSESSHLSKKSNLQSNSSIVLLQSIAVTSTFLNDNKHHIEYCEKITQAFKCKVCNHIIPHSHNVRKLRSSLITHFSSKQHLNCVKAHSFFKLLETSRIPGKENHKFYVSKGWVFCSVCKVEVDGNVFLHIQSKTESVFDTNLRIDQDTPIKLEIPTDKENGLTSSEDLNALKYLSELYNKSVTSVVDDK